MCGADAGVCPAWKAAGEVGNNNCKSVDHMRRHSAEMGWHMCFGHIRGVAHLCTQPSRWSVTPLHPSGAATLPLQLRLSSPSLGCGGPRDLKAGHGGKSYICGCSHQGKAVIFRCTEECVRHLLFFCSGVTSTPLGGAVNYTQVEILENPLRIP